MEAVENWSKVVCCLSEGIVEDGYLDGNRVCVPLHRALHDQALFAKEEVF
jgi:hypothetical protein